MNSDLKSRLFVLAIAVLIWFIFTECQGAISTDTWNHGRCKCGGHWVYQQAISRGYYGMSTRYMYKCDKCGRIVELTNYYQ